MLERMTTQSVILLKNLDQDNSTVQKELALSLRNRGIALWNKKKWDDAVNATQESVKLWRNLDQHDPEIRKELAWTLYYLRINLEKKKSGIGMTLLK